MILLAELSLTLPLQSSFAGQKNCPVKVNLYTPSSGTLNFPDLSSGMGIQL